MYQKTKRKRSSTLLPNLNSPKYDILRKPIGTLPLDECGWKYDNGAIVAVWYTCSQFPPVNKKRKIDVQDTDEQSKCQESKRSRISTDENEYLSPNNKGIFEICTGHPDENRKNNDDEFDENDDEWEHLSDFSLTDDSSSDDTD